MEVWNVNDDYNLLRAFTTRTQTQSAAGTLISAQTLTTTSTKGHRRRRRPPTRHESCTMHDISDLSGLHRHSQVASSGTRLQLPSYPPRQHNTAPIPHVSLPTGHRSGHVVIVVVRAICEVRIHCGGALCQRMRGRSVINSEFEEIVGDFDA